MLPGHTLIVKCPYCKGTKSLMTLMSGNTFGGRQWWDLKTFYPMLPHVSWVQKCPHCGGYYMYETARKKEGRDYSGETGRLDYADMRQAWAQLKGTAKGQHKCNLMLEYVWAYNDEFQRGDSVSEERRPSPEELAEFREIVLELVKVFKVESEIIHAEYLREAGLFDEALALIGRVGIPQEGIYKTLAETIISKCASRDTSVGLIE